MSAHAKGEGPKIVAVEIEREPEGSTVLSVRMPRALLRRLTEVARQRDEPAGRLARRFIEQGVQSESRQPSKAFMWSIPPDWPSGVSIHITCHGVVPQWSIDDELQAMLAEEGARPA
jgi:hypothetical protein